MLKAHTQVLNCAIVFRIGLGGFADSRGVVSLQVTAMVF